MGNSSGERVTYCKLLSKSRFSFAAAAAALGYFNYCHMEPILANRLVEKDLTVMQTGLFFAIFPVFYIPSSILV